MTKSYGTLLSRPPQRNGGTHALATTGARLGVSRSYSLHDRRTGGPCKQWQLLQHERAAIVSRSTPSCWRARAAHSRSAQKGAPPERPGKSADYSRCVLLYSPSPSCVPVVAFTGTPL